MEKELMLRIVNIDKNRKLFEITSKNYEEIELMLEAFDKDYITLKDTPGFIEHNSRCFEFTDPETGFSCIEYLMDFICLEGG